MRFLRIAPIIFVVCFLLPCCANDKTQSVLTLGVFMNSGGKGPPRISAIKLAVAEINSRSDILPNTTIQMVSKNQGGTTTVAMASAMALVQNQVDVIIGPMATALSQQTSVPLSYYKIPHFSPSASGASLSDKTQYEYFMRACPSDAVQGPAMARFVNQLGWRNVACLSTNDEFGTLGMQAFRSQALALNISVPIWESFSTGGGAAACTVGLERIRTSGTKVIVMFMVGTDAVPCLNVAITKGMHVPGWVWFAIDSVADDAVFAANPTLIPAFQGMVGMRPLVGTGPKYATFLDTWSALNSTLWPGAGTRNPPDKVPHAYDTIFAIAYGVDRLLRTGYNMSRNSTTCPTSVISPSGPSLKASLYKTNFTGITGLFQLDANGDRIGQFEVINLQGDTFAVVASYDIYAGFLPLPMPIVWKEGFTGNPDDSVLSCGFGSFVQQQGWQQSCYICPAGTYADYTTKNCTLCPPGTFTASTASLECSKCSEGRYSDTYGATECKMCPPGNYAPVAGMQQCHQCHLGSYQPEWAQWDCKPCGFTEYMPSTQAAACIQCPTNSVTGAPESTDISQCRCKKGFFSLSRFNESSTDKTCHLCPDNADCEDLVLSPQQGYWIPPWDVLTVQHCENIDACLGGANNTCAEGYTGSLCALCLPGYSRSGAYVCSPCGNTGLTIFLLFCSLAIAVAAVIFMVRSAVVAAQSLVTNRSDIATIAKIFVSYLQVTSQASKFKAAWPAYVMSLFSSQEMASNPIDSLVSLQCVAGDENLGGMSLFYIKVISYLVLPVLFIVVPAAVFGVWKLLRQLRASLSSKRTQGANYLSRDDEPVESIDDGSRHALYDLFIVTVVVGLFLIHPLVSRTILEIYRCRAIGNDHPFLQADLSVECYSTSHKTWMFAVGLPTLLLFVIGMPILAFWILFWHRTTLDQPQTVLRFGFIYKGYKSQRWYWEMVVIQRKLLVIIINVFFGSRTYIQGLLILGLLVVNLLSTSILRPYDRSHLNWLEVGSILVSLLTLYCGMYYLTELTNDDSTPLTVFLLVFNLAYIAIVVFYMSRAIFSKVRMIYPEIMKSLSRKNTPTKSAIASFVAVKSSSRVIDAEPVMNFTKKGSPNGNTLIPLDALSAIDDRDFTLSPVGQPANPESGRQVVGFLRDGVPMTPTSPFVLLDDKIGTGTVPLEEDRPIEPFMRNTKSWVHSGDVLSEITETVDAQVSPQLRSLTLNGQMHPHAS